MQNLFLNKLLRTTLTIDVLNQVRYNIIEIKMAEMGNRNYKTEHR